MFVRKALRVTALFGYALIILTIVNETKGMPTAQTIFEKCDQTHGFFFAPGTGLTQCLKVFPGRVSWDDAKTKCAQAGLVMARPFNALKLRQYLFEKHSSLWQFWVDAKANGKQMLWQRSPEGLASSEAVPFNSPLWWSGPTQDSHERDGQCMVLTTYSKYINSAPDNAYYSQGCSVPTYPNTLCERLLNI